MPTDCYYCGYFAECVLVEMSTGGHTFEEFLPALVHCCMKCFRVPLGQRHFIAHKDERPEKSG